jgi:hypothetical protein
MTKYLVTYVVRGAFSVEVDNPSDDPAKAKDKVRDLIREIPGSMEHELVVHYLEELS